MTNEEKYEHWEDIAKYDLESAKAMYKSGRYLYVVFMCQQSIEKLIKGLHVLYTGDEPVRTHNIWVVFRAVFENDHTSVFDEGEEKYKDFFAELVAYYISERYPSYQQKLSESINKKQAKDVLKKTEEAFQWLKSLKKSN